MTDPSFVERFCQRPRCRNYASATLTYDYAERTAVLGPLAAERGHGGHDLCDDHAARVSPPVGWQLVRAGRARTEQSATEG